MTDDIEYEKLRIEIVRSGVPEITKKYRWLIILPNGQVWTACAGTVAGAAAAAASALADDPQELS